MPNPVEGARYIEGHHGSVKAVVKGVLPSPGEEHEEIGGGPPRSEPKLLFREEVIVLDVATHHICHHSLKHFPHHREQGDGSVVFWVRPGAPLVDGNNPGLFPH